jgi:hypothetical protein
MRYFFAYRFYVPEIRFGNICIWWAGLGRLRAGRFLVGGSGIPSQSAAAQYHVAAVLLITKETHNEQTINLAAVRSAGTP